MLWKHESPTSSKLLRVSAMTPSRLNDSLIRGLILPVVCCLLFLHSTGFGIGQERYVETVAHAGSFPIAERGVAAPIYVDAGDYAGVVRVARDLKSDIARATGDTPTIKFAPSGLGKHVIIIGTIGKSPLIDRLIQSRKIDVSRVSGQWESFLIQVVANPLPGVASGLVIAGSDKRGTIYGIYDVSEQIGVSPWYWWAGVPVEHREALYVEWGRGVQGPPAVKYRGIFLNDEA